MRTLTWPEPAKVASQSDRFAHVALTNPLCPLGLLSYNTSGPESWR